MWTQVKSINPDGSAEELNFFREGGCLDGYKIMKAIKCSVDVICTLQDDYRN